MCEENFTDYVANHVIDLIDKGYKVCIWGTEEKASKTGVLLLQRCNIPIACYCDDNPDKWGKEIIKNKYCITPEELKRESKKYLCIIMVNDTDTFKIMKQIETYGIKYYCGFYDLLCSEYALHCFYPFTLQPKGNSVVKRNDVKVKKNLRLIEDKIVVYTCVTGGYDNAYDPKVVEEDCDYYIISEKKPDTHIYKWIPLSTLDIPDGLSNALINRYCKINVHKIFPQYKYSIYVDGNNEIKKKISKKFLEKLEGKVTGIACRKRNCKISDIYRDGIHVLISAVADESKVQKQMEQYWKEGLPEYHGQNAGNIWVREHNNPICVSIMEEWWSQVSTQAPRDQLSFMYAVWKNGYCFDDIGILDVRGWHNETYDIWKHVKGYGE